MDMLPWPAINIALLIWAITAHACAAASGTIALRRSMAALGTPAAPMCLIVDSTRWLFGARLSRRSWTPGDFIALAILFGIFASIMFFAQNVTAFVTEKGVIAGGTPEQALRHARNVLAGSGLIVLHCGVALHYGEKNA